MHRVLIVDDDKIFLESLCRVLHGEGYEAVGANNAKQALEEIARQAVDLILLNIFSRNLNGLGLLSTIRQRKQGKTLPVIVFSEKASGESVRRSAELGVRDYLIKCSASLSELLARIAQRLSKPIAGAEIVSAAGAGEVKPAALKKIALRKAESIARIEKFTESKALAGVVMQIMQLVTSPRASLHDLIHLLKKDAIVATKVLQVANSAAYATNRVRVATIDDAVRIVGLSTVGNLAASIGVFDAFPPEARDGFSVLRCWQHAFAAAAILERLTAVSELVSPSVGYLVGLCHDLSEIVLRQCFSEEYEYVLSEAVRTVTPVREIEAATFGTSHHELSRTILKRFALPDPIAQPILEYEGISLPKKGSVAMALRAADQYANGLLLASSLAVPVSAIARGELASIYDENKPLPFDGDEIRGTVRMNTSLLASLPAADAARLSQPQLSRGNRRIGYLRDADLSSLDPLACALQAIAETTVFDELPAEIGGEMDLIVAAANKESAAAQIKMARERCQNARTICAITFDAGATPATIEGVPLRRMPMTLGELHQLISVDDREKLPEPNLVPSDVAA